MRQLIRLLQLLRGGQDHQLPKAGLETGFRAHVPGHLQESRERGRLIGERPVQIEDRASHSANLGVRRVGGGRRPRVDIAQPRHGQ